MNAQNKQLRKRWRSSNTCVMCGLPFVSVGRIGLHSDIMQQIQSLYKERYSSAPGLFDIPNDCHLFHRKDWGVFPKEAGSNTRPLPELTDEEKRGIRDTHCLNMDSILRILRDKRQEDDEFALGTTKDRKLIRPSTEKITERLYALQTITFAGCKRCNDLMTMQKPTSQMSVACQILRPGFHKHRTLVRQAREYLRHAGEEIGNDDDIEGEDDPQLYGLNDNGAAVEEQPDEEADAEAPPVAEGGDGDAGDDAAPAAPGVDQEEEDRRNALRVLATQRIKQAAFSEKLAFQELLKRSVQRARKYFTQFTLQELFTLFHAYAYVLAANLTCERVEIQEIQGHDQFRIDGLQKVYVSFFFYVVNTVRFPVMFTEIPFEVWHTSFVEMRTLSTCVSFRTSVFQNQRFVPEYTRRSTLSWEMMEDDLMKKTRIGLLRMMISPKEAKVQILKFSNDNRQLWRWRLPSVWQLAWMALGDHAIRNRVSRNNAMLWEHRRYFPTPSYIRHVYENLFTVTELNIDRWVEEFGRRMMYRRLLSTAQFSLDTVCLDYLQKTLLLVKPEGGEVAKLSVRKRNYIKFVIEMFIEIHQKARIGVIDAGDYYSLQLVDFREVDPLRSLRQDFKNESDRHLLFAVGPQSDDEVDDTDGAVGMHQVEQGMAAMAMGARVAEPGYSAAVEAVRSAAARLQAEREHAEQERVILEDQRGRTVRRSSRIAAQPRANIFERAARAAQRRELN